MKGFVIGAWLGLILMISSYFWASQSTLHHIENLITTPTAEAQR